MNSHRARQYFINPFGKVNNISKLKKGRYNRKYYKPIFITHIVYAVLLLHIFFILFVKTAHWAISPLFRFRNITRLKYFRTRKWALNEGVRSCVTLIKLSKVIFNFNNYSFINMPKQCMHWLTKKYGNCNVKLQFF